MPNSGTNGEDEDSEFKEEQMMCSKLNSASKIGQVSSTAEAVYIQKALAIIREETNSTPTVGINSNQQTDNLKGTKREGQMKDQDLYTNTKGNVLA